MARARDETGISTFLGVAPEQVSVADPRAPSGWDAWEQKPTTDPVQARLEGLDSIDALNQIGENLAKNDPRHFKLGGTDSSSGNRRYLTYRPDDGDAVQIPLYSTGGQQGGYSPTQGAQDFRNAITQLQQVGVKPEALAFTPKQRENAFRDPILNAAEDLNKANSYILPIIGAALAYTTGGLATPVLGTVGGAAAAGAVGGATSTAISGGDSDDYLKNIATGAAIGGSTGALSQAGNWGEGVTGDATTGKALTNVGNTAVRMGVTDLATPGAMTSEQWTTGLGGAAAAPLADAAIPDTGVGAVDTSLSTGLANGAVAALTGDSEAVRSAAEQGLALGAARGATQDIAQNYGLDRSTTTALGSAAQTAASGGTGQDIAVSGLGGYVASATGQPVLGTLAANAARPQPQQRQQQFNINSLTPAQQQQLAAALRARQQRTQGA